MAICRSAWGTGVLLGVGVAVGVAVEVDVAVDVDVLVEMDVEVAVGADVAVPVEPGPEVGVAVDAAGVEVRVAGGREVEVAVG